MLYIEIQYLDINLSNKHILILSKWYPSHNYTSAGIFVKRHALAVSPHTNLSILYAEADEQVRWNIKKEWTNEDGLDTLRYYFPKRITGVSFLDKFLKLLLYFYCISKGYAFLEKRKGKFDLVHVTVLLRTGVFAYFNHWFRNVPYVITEHWTGYLELTQDYKKSFYRKWLTPWVIKRAKVIAPASDDLGKAMQNLGLTGRYLTIHNVVDTDFFKPQTHPSKKTILRILTVAMLLDKHKNISGILRVLKRIKDQGHTFQYEILGKGADARMLADYATELGLEHEVRFLGLQPARTVAEKMQSADFLLLFSNYENLPCVIVEALASGIPVVATDVGGISEMIRHDGLGTMVPAGNEDALEKAVLSVLERMDTFDTNEIRTFAVGHFSKKYIGERIRKLYEMALEE